MTIAGSDGLVVEGTVVAAGAHITAPNGPLEVKGTWPVPGNAVGIRLLDKDDHIVFDAWQDGRVQVNKIQVSAGATITAPNGPLEVKGTWPVPGNAVGIRLLDKSNNIVFDVWQDGRTRTAVLEITGGTDISEPFSVTADATIEKGTVLVIDHEHDGRLRVSDSPYDNRVAGIASGAGGISPGITIGRKTRFRDESEVAVSGRVYCKATASNGPIRPGDLLTTSREPGHAMKATDFTRRQGAILGKAMTALERGEGLVLVLVSLQ